MNGPSPSNAELANFFRNHSKNSKLSKEESNYVENILFSRSSPATLPLSLFPRATPVSTFSWEPKSLSSTLPSVSEIMQRSSRKKLELEVLETDLEISKSLFACEDDVPAESISDFQGLEYLDARYDDKSVKISKVDSNLSDASKIPRKMTDAAKELMASIQMHLDSSTDEQKDDEMNPIENNQAIPAFEFEIPAKKLPEFHFDISVAEPSKPIFIAEQQPKEPEFKFHFDLSEFKASTKLYYQHSNTILPQFNFKLD